VPVRIRIVGNRIDQSGQNASRTETTETAQYLRALEGQSVNLSERGICFKSREKMSIGQIVEMFLIIPREVTGRSSEPVGCSARVVHADQLEDAQGMRGRRGDPI
jgi:hypothetical protein